MSSARAQCDDASILGIPISYLHNSGNPMIDGEINDIPVKILLDTGSYGTFLIKEPIVQMGLEVRLSRNRIAGIGGLAALYVAHPKMVKIGSAVARGISFPVMDSLGNTGAAGLAGADFLLQKDLEISFSENVIKFISASGCKNEKEILGQGTLEIPLESEGRGFKPLVQIEIDGKTVLALIDTGAKYSYVDYDTFLDTPEKLLRAQSSSGAVHGIGNESATAWQLAFNYFKMGDEVIENVSLKIIKMKNSRHKMIIGRDFLKSHNIIVSISENKIYFKYVGGGIFRYATGQEILKPD